MAGAEDELQRIQLALSTTAHELRNPAAVVLTLAEELRSDRASLDEELVDELLSTIIRQAGVIDRITADLLTITRPEKTAVTMNSQPVELPASRDR